MSVNKNNRKSTVWNATKDDWVLLLCLFFSVSELFAHAKLFILPVLFLLVGKKYMSMKNRSVVYWLLAFSLLYVLPYITHLTVSSRTDYIVFLTPPIFYMTGCYLGTKYRYDERTLLAILFIMLFMYAFVHFTTLLYSTISNRGEVLVNRMVVNAEGNETTSSTLYAIYMSVIIAGLSFLFTLRQKGNLREIRILSVVLAALAIWGMVTTVTRTSVVEAFVMLVFSVYMVLRERKKNKGVSGFMFGVILLACIGYFLTNNNDVSQFFEAYEARNELAEYGADTFGGRLYRWATSLEDILFNPLGTQTGHILSFPYHGSYAHNMWLDVGLTAGWVPLVILLSITIRNIRQSIRLLNNKSYGYYIRLYFFALFLVFMLSSFIEPILLAVYSHFLIYLVFCGMVSEMKTKF